MESVSEVTPPAVSVVVASFNGESALRRCLESLEANARQAEHVVATNLGAEAAAQLRQRFPRTRLYCFPSGTDVFRLRSLGVAEARGRLIAMIEDHCTVAPEWLAALQEAHQAGHKVIGGPVDNGLTQRNYHWALYLCEYGSYMPPLPTGTVAALSAVNTAYEREALWRCRSVWELGFHDNEVHDALRGAGCPLHLEGEARVHSYLAMTPSEAVRHLFAGGRRFGGYR